MAAPALHALGWHLQHQFESEGLSAAQEWLLEAVLSELEYRRRRELRRRRSLDACHCVLCWVPWEPVHELEPLEPL